MQKLVFLPLISLVLLMTLLFLHPFDSAIHKSDAYGMESQLPLRERWMNKMLADPATGKVPYRIREKELAFSRTLPVAEEKFKNVVEDGFWSSRGPWNIGGRTRAIAIDRMNENILLAGGIGNYHGIIEINERNLAFIR